VNNGGKTDGSSDKKVVTLPAPAGNNGPANTGNNGGKITSLPVNNGGRINSGQDTKVDVKTSMPGNTGVTTRPQLNNAPVMKLNNNPSQGNKFNQGNSQPAKVSFGGNNGGNNGGSRMAMGGNQMRRGF
jgi:hypothetical protein